MEDLLTAQPEMGNAPESAPLEPQAGVQTPPEPQTSGVPQVEGNGNQPQAVEPQRRVSNFYQERERFRKLEKAFQDQSSQMAEMKSLLQELKNPKPVDSAIQKLTAEELLNDPDKVFQSREQRLRDEFETLRQELTQIKSKEANAEAMKSEREALEMLFPKSSPEADEPLETRLDNKERYELVARVLKANPSLDRLMRIDPKGAAEFVLEKVNKLKSQTSPNAIPKTLMGGTHRGNPGAGSKLTPESLMSEIKKMSSEEDKNPELRFDAKRREKKQALMKQAAGLMKE